MLSGNRPRLGHTTLQRIGLLRHVSLTQSGIYWNKFKTVMFIEQVCCFKEECLAYINKEMFSFYEHEQSEFVSDILWYKIITLR